jgi:hypothetical protein
MPRANLKGIAEIEFLRQAVRSKFESHANRTLVANTNKGNYVLLAEEISSMAQANAKGTRLEKMDMTVSEGQVRSLFLESNKDFLDYFVQACYFYTQGISREDFLSLEENTERVKTWEQDKNGRQLFAYLPASTEINPAFEIEKSSLEDKIQFLRRQLKRFGGIAGLLTLLSLSLFVYTYYRHEQEIERVKIWSGSRGNIEKEILLPQLEFLEPQSAFIQVVDTIIQSLLTPSVFYSAEASLPIVHYKNIVATSGYKKYRNSFYPDQISIIPFHGFANTRIDSAIIKTRGMASYLYSLYSRNAFKNDGTYVEKDILAKIMGLDKTAFDVDLIYVGYKQDIDVPDSDDFMLRYPPYKMDEANLQDYVMINRQWWKEAIQKTGIHWRQNFNGQMRECGISKPYPTVRVNAPNQRTFWVEVVIDSLNPKTEMVLAIDLVLKE